MQQTKPIEFSPLLIYKKSGGNPADETTDVRILGQPDDLLQEARRWDLLQARADMPTHQMAWLESCVNSFGRTEKPIWVVIGGKQPRAIAPLARLGSRLVTIGVDELYEPMAFPSTDGKSLGALADAVARLGKPLFMKRIPADSPVIPALKRAYRGRGIVMTRPVAGCPWIPLDSTWMEPEMKLSAARRSSLRRARRHAENIGKVEWEFCPSDRMTLARGLEEAFRIESAGWKGRTGTALLNDERRRAFYESYVEMAAGVGTARLCFLKIGGKAVAMQVAVECADRYWLLKVGYDEEYSKCSPGNLLMLETIRHAARQGFKSYEFLGTNEPWTSNWTEHVRPCVSLLAYPINVPGMAALAGDAVRVGLDRIRRRKK